MNHLMLDEGLLARRGAAATGFPLSLYSGGGGRLHFVVAVIIIFSTIMTITTIITVIFILVACFVWSCYTHLLNI